MIFSNENFHGGEAGLDLHLGHKPRIVILSASVGSGHVRAASAIESALGSLLPDATVAHIDALNLTNGAFRKAYGDGYFRAARSAPRFVGWMYDFLDHPDDRSATTVTRQFFERMNFTRLSKLLTDQAWDLAICTHFLPAALIARMRRRELIQFPQAVVVTDFDVHGLWISRPCEGFFVATSEARANLAAQDIDANDIHVTGIPIDPIFAEPMDRAVALRELDLPGDRPIVLQMAGGFGIGSIERIHRAILQIDRPLQVVTVTGRNTDAMGILAAMDHDPRHKRKILGYTTQMRQLLAVADVIVTKPGGLTSAESLASGCPIIIAEPIPGQEDRNADYLLENGCALKVNNLASLPFKLGSLLNDADRLSAMRASAFRSARPKAAFEVAAGCVELLDRSHELV